MTNTQGKPKNWFLSSPWVYTRSSINFLDLIFIKTLKYHFFTRNVIQKSVDIILSFILRKWRNWQTRYLEVVVGFSSWGFESPLSQSFFNLYRLSLKNERILASKPGSIFRSFNRSKLFAKSNSSSRCNSSGDNEWA